MNLFDNENQKENHFKNKILVQSNKKNMPIGELFQNRDDMTMIASWVYQKGLKTQIYYKRIVRDFFYFYPQLSLKTTQITHLVLFLKTYKTFSDSTRNTYKNALCSLFSFAVKTGYLEKNPALALENLKTPDQLFSKVLSREQIERLILKEKNNRNQLILKILYYTGIRVDELSHLKVNSFQNSQNGWIMIVIGKGRKVRSIHLPTHLSDEIKKYISAVLDSLQDNSEGLSEYLFTNDRRVDFGINDFSRTPLSNSQIFRIVKTAAKNAGLDIQPSPHWLRHTSATHAIENGAPVHVVQRSLGHESISTTGRYLEIRPKESVGNYIKPITNIL